MSKFERAYDKAWQQLADSLGRDPHSDEAEVLEGTLFNEWIAAEKFDDLIKHLHDSYEREGGFTDIAVLCVALRKQKDVARIEKLIGGFIKMREKLFWAGWPKAQEGHLGYMRDCAKLAAAACSSVPRPRPISACTPSGNQCSSHNSASSIREAKRRSPACCYSFGPAPLRGCL